MGDFKAQYLGRHLLHLVDGMKVLTASVIRAARCDLLSLLTAANSCFHLISLHRLLLFFPFLSVSDFFEALLRCGGVGRGFNCNTPHPDYFIIYL